MDAASPLFFCGHSDRHGDRRVLSNWHLCNFVDENGQLFCNTEQFMMYHKALLFGDNDMATKILAEPDPKKIKRMGRQVKNFDPEIWNSKARDIVYSGCLLKFSQNPELKQFILSTGNRLLVEASSYDKIWGIGLSEEQAKSVPQEQWPGTNWLGECLMKVRETLANKN